MGAARSGGKPCGENLTLEPKKHAPQGYARGVSNAFAHLVDTPRFLHWRLNTAIFDADRVKKRK